MLYWEKYLEEERQMLEADRLVIYAASEKEMNEIIEAERDEALREAYGENPEHAKLVIKINNPKDEDIAFVEEHIGGTAGYTLITELTVI